MVRSIAFPLVCLALGSGTISAYGQLAPYNPYADSQEAPAPLAADGTIQWGVFYKSAAMQKAYQRLWNLGACRGTNRAITEPVNRNKVIIDRLPEADYEGTVVAAAGTLAGGMIVFSEQPQAATAEPFLAQLHPAGVTRLRVTGRTPAAIVRPGHVLRVVAEVDEQGVATEPLARFDLVTPPADYEPAEVKPGVRGEIVGVAKRLHKGGLTLHVPAGRLRRLSFSLPDDAVATLDAARLDLVAPGDTIRLTGRRWSGDGAMGAGTIFASDVSLSKPPLAGEVAAPGAADVANQP
jgi:hypothetical protein